jgi:hypothetical protein
MAEKKRVEGGKMEGGKMEGGKMEGIWGKALQSSCHHPCTQTDTVTVHRQTRVSMYVLMYLGNYMHIPNHPFQVRTSGTAR